MRGLISVLTVMGVLFSVQPAKADTRVAFVIGNGAYTHAARLSKPPDDVRAIADTLTSVGFDVLDGTDLTREEIIEGLRRFGVRATGADIALFFFAGYGMSIDGDNYLLPVDADPKSADDVKKDAINVKREIGNAMSGANTRLVFLDACRENPFVKKLRSTIPPGTFRLLPDLPKWNPESEP